MTPKAPVPRHVVIAGRSGVGKTTVAANVSAALAEEGLRVMQVGYGLARDSTARLRGERKPLPVTLAAPDREPPTASVGLGGVVCVEAGRIGPGTAHSPVGHIGGHISRHLPDVVVHDLTWESHGERLLLPFGPEGAIVYTVITADFPAVYAANNLFRTLNGRAAARNDLRLGGIIANNLRASYAESIVRDFSTATGVTVASSLPHSLVAQMCEMYGRTVIDAAPHSQLAFAFRRLARTIADRRGSPLPHSLTPDELQSWGDTWGRALHELDNGIISVGAGI